MKVISSKEAAGLIRDGWTLSTSGFTGSGHPEGISTAIENRFLETGHPRDLTLIYAAGQGGQLTLTEIAPGIDLEREVHAQIAPGVGVAEDLKTMDARIFRAQPMLRRP
jgi:acyl CoA:acetate/3-ketoacid CoA transferase